MPNKFVSLRNLWFVMVGSLQQIKRSLKLQIESGICKHFLRTSELRRNSNEEQKSVGNINNFFIIVLGFLRTTEVPTNFC